MEKILLVAKKIYIITWRMLPTETISTGVMAGYATSTPHLGTQAKHFTTFVTFSRPVVSAWRRADLPSTPAFHPVQDAMPCPTQYP